MYKEIQEDIGIPLKDVAKRKTKRKKEREWMKVKMSKKQEQNVHGNKLFPVMQ